MKLILAAIRSKITWVVLEELVLAVGSIYCSNEFALDRLSLLHKSFQLIHNRNFPFIIPVVPDVAQYIDQKEHLSLNNDNLVAAISMTSPNILFTNNIEC